MITLFDILGRSKIPYSPNTWKVRLALNYKGLAYKTRYVEIVDIEAICKALGIPPSGTKPTGEPHYTLPAIIDDSMPDDVIRLSDSRPIIEYLERAYPPSKEKDLFPPGTHNCQTMVQDIILNRILSHTPFLWLFDLYRVKTPKDRENIKTRMEARFQKPMDQIIVSGEEWQKHWAEVRRAFSDIDRLALYSEPSRSNGLFLAGQHATYADIVMCALLLCLKTCISDTEWCQIASWNKGRWNRLLEAFEPWMKVDGDPVWRA